LLLPVVVALATAGVSGCGSEGSTEPPGQESRTTNPGSRQGEEKQDAAVLLFTRTVGFRHASIPAAVAAIEARAADARLTVESTEDPGAFNDLNLSRFDAVVFLLTTGDVLDPTQEAAFEHFVRGGGGYAGVHSATDTEYDWAFYGALVGAYFKDHPLIQPATVAVDDRGHPSTSMLPATWPRSDEWYNFRAQPVDAKVLARVDESTYTGGSMGAIHPVVWYRVNEGSRSWYTAMGHGDDSWGDARFVDHVIGGIAWAARLR
jgi:type 1 glutamine amidotransferase